MIPSGPGKKRQKGVRKPLVAFRCPDDLLAYIRANESDRVDRTDVILKLLQVAKDAGETMGARWWEVELTANVTHTPPGVVLGHLAVEALDARAKKKK